MKHSVVFDEYDQLELKPPALLRRYMELLEDDVRRLLVEAAELADVPCPGCRESVPASTFKRCGLRYVECAICGTLYISPRPDDRSLRQFYLTSSTSDFWRNEFSRETSPQRSARIIKPRFRWIADSVAEYLPGAVAYADVNTNQLGYLNEIQGSGFARRTLIDPFVDTSALAPVAVDIESRAVHELMPADMTCDVISLFEVGDRVSDLDRLLTAVRGLLHPGGLCFMTATFSTGFDLQVLGERAPNLHPPDRLNVLSIEGLRRAVSRTRFECLELSTPGIFDCSNVEQAMARDSELRVPKFVRYLLQQRDEPIKQAFQEFLQSSLLSSYGRVLLRRPAEEGRA